MLAATSIVGGDHPPLTSAPTGPTSGPGWLGEAGFILGPGGATCATRNFILGPGGATCAIRNFILGATYAIINFISGGGLRG